MIFVQTKLFYLSVIPFPFHFTTSVTCSFSIVILAVFQSFFPTPTGAMPFFVDIQLQNYPFHKCPALS